MLWINLSAFFNITLLYWYSLILSFRVLCLQPPWQPFPCWLILMCAHYSFAFGLTRLHPHLVSDGKDSYPSERGHTISRQLCSVFFFFFHLWETCWLSLSKCIWIVIGKKKRTPWNSGMYEPIKIPKHIMNYYIKEDII